MALITVEVHQRVDPSAPGRDWAVGIFGLPGVLGDGVKWITNFPTKAEANAWTSALTFKNIVVVQQPKEEPPFAVGIDGVGTDGGIKWITRFPTLAAVNAYKNSLTWGGFVLAS
jgi:hypothetical protein